MDLSSKVAIVTGAGPNIGRSIAVALARSGAKVVCNDIRPETSADSAAYISDLGYKAASIAGDITDEDQVEAVVHEAVETFGPIDILVNNAAMTVPHGLLDTTLDEWNRVLKVNLTGTFLMARAVAKRMVAASVAGSIVNIASTSGHRGRGDALAYCSSKGGVLNATRAMAVDLAPYGIRVNSVSPTKTGSSVADLETAEGRLYPEILLGRLGHPQDQASAVLFLASDESRFCTGIDLRVDGGALATWGISPDALVRLKAKDGP